MKTHQSCSKAELDLSTTPPVNDAMVKGDVVQYKPLSSVADGAPIEFQVASTPDDYIDLGRTSLYVKLKVTRANGDNLPQDAHVGVVNLTLHSLFSQV